MKNIRLSRIVTTARLPRAGMLVLALLAAGQLVAATSKNPTSKFYVADLAGHAEVNTGEKIEDLTNSSVFSAEGTVIETKADSTNAIVLSNGTGIFFESDSRLEIRRFLQEPFLPNRTDLETEPSISQTQSHLPRGTIGLCTSKLVAGSVMTISTPLAEVSVRGQKLVVQSTDDETRVSLIAGDVTVRGEGFSGGEILQPGQQAVVTRGAPGQPPLVVIRPIPEADLPALEEKVTQACMARRTVYFDIAERQNETEDPPELTPVPVTPVNPDDIGPVISSSALPGN